MLSPQYENSTQDDKKFYIESYYNIISKFTPKSFFLDMTLQEAKAIVSFYRYNAHNKPEEFTKENLTNINHLKSKIQTEILRFRGESFFIRLSNRSPKDGELFNKQNLTDLYKKELSTIKLKWNPDTWANYGIKITEQEIEANYNLIAYFRLTERYSIRCSTVDDAMNLLLTSERIYVDLIRELRYIEKEKEAKFDVKLVLREWVDGINGLMEFRCFVKGNIMTAISQYNHYVIVEDLINEAGLLAIRDRIYTYWREYLRDTLASADYNDYVIDIAILDNDQLVVIELNPFNSLTGGSMFLWNVDKDILEGIDTDKSDYTSKDIAIRARKVVYDIMKDFSEVIVEEGLTINKNKNYLEAIEAVYPRSKCCIY
jgi:hypothetical protein